MFESSIGLRLDNVASFVYSFVIFLCLLAMTALIINVLSALSLCGMHFTGTLQPVSAIKNINAFLREILSFQSGRFPK